MDTLHDNSKMPFGKHKDKAMINVPATYLLWLYEKGCDNKQVYNYIQSNLDALNKEAGRAKAWKR